MLVIILLCVIGVFLGYVYNKQITSWELFVTCLCTIIIAHIVFAICNLPFPNDTFFESGRLQKVTYYPYFKERYTQMHTSTYPCGKSTCTRVYTTTEYKKHREYWTTTDSLNQTFYISSKEYSNIAKVFGNNEKQYKDKNRYDYNGTCVQGDDSTYIVKNETNTYNFPTTQLSSWHNPITKKNSLFNNKQKTLLSYPHQQDYRHNNRLQAKTDFTNVQWDMFNTQIYEKVQANVNLIQYDDGNELKMGWNNGKKNDINIVFKGAYNQPEIVKVFGWYDSEILSAQLEEYILTNGISQQTLPYIKQIIIEGYKPFDFKQFKYLKTPSIGQLIITALLTWIAIGFIFTAFGTNEYYRK